MLSQISRKCKYYLFPEEKSFKLTVFGNNQSKKQEHPIRMLLRHGAGHGNQYAFSPMAKIKVATSVCTGGRNCSLNSFTPIGSLPLPH
jgi:hypothetical protein